MPSLTTPTMPIYRPNGGTNRKLPKRALSAILAQPWAILPEYLDTIISIARLEGDPDYQTLDQTDPNAPRRDGQVQRLDGGGRFAVVPVVGPIFPRANTMTQHSGATSLDMVAAAFEASVADAAVDAVVMHYDSPGGVVAGIAEFAEEIRAATAIKPVISYVYGMAASAAYWLAVAGSHVVMHRSAQVGSIGVVASLAVQEKPDQFGEFVYEIVSSNAPNKRPDPRTEEGRAEIVARIDQLEAIFIGDIASYRGVTTDKVLTDFGRGGMHTGEEALTRGMVDAIGGFVETLADFGQSRPGPFDRSSEASEGIRMAQTTNKADETSVTAAEPKPVTAASIKAEHPDVAKALIDEGKVEGLKDGRGEGAIAERERQAQIDQLVEPGDDAKLVADLRASGKDIGTVALELSGARKETRANALTDRVEGGSDAAPLPATTDDMASNKPDVASMPPGEEKYRAEWDADSKVREEYGGDDANFSRYAAYRKMEDQGRIRRGSAVQQ